MDPAAYSDVPRYVCTSSALHRFGGKAAGEDEGNLRGFNPPLVFRVTTVHTTMLWALIWLSSDGQSGVQREILIR